MAAATDSADNGNAAPETPSSPAATPPASDAAPPTAAASAAAAPRWPGWPGDSVFRLIVPVLTVGSIIGRKGELIKKMCEETRARIRIFEGAIGTTDRIVLISGKDEPDAAVSPAMDAVVRVFKRVCGVQEGEGEALAQVRSSIRLLVAGSQAIYLIGKQGSVIKSIQETSGASVRVLPENEVPFYAAPDERIVDIQGEYIKVLKALEAVTGQLRKFLVDHSVLPLFEKAYNASAAPDRSADLWSDKAHETTPTGISSDYSLSMKRDSLFLDREHQLEPQIPRSRLSIYGQDPTLPGPHTSGLGRVMVTQVTQTMQIPLSYAEDIIGIGGANIAYIRRTSGAILTVQESVGMPDEITVEIKGTSSQVQTAQQLIQDCISVHKEPSTGGYGLRDTGSGGYGLRDTGSGGYGSRDAGYRSYSHLPPSSYSSSMSSQSLDDYGPPGLGGYSRYRL